MEEIKLTNDSNNNSGVGNHKGIWIGIIGVVVLLIIVISIACAVPGDGGASSSTYLTYSNYTKIQNGMSYSQVVDILGDDPGVLDSSSSYGGYTLSYYTWSNNSGSKCIVVGFENGKVCAKSQYGLK
ncbi:MAG: DUF3862 domain-containing protein [Clostridia bacterium]|nr:DUF3862 domain-containing protein [Clostridia bacterium]